MAIDNSPFGELVHPATAPERAGAPPPGMGGAGDDGPELLMRLGRALHTAGTPAHRIEEGMEAASRRLGLAGQFFSTPTALFASFGSGGGRRTILERVQPGDVNLERMSDLDEMLGRFAAGELTPGQASVRLADLDGSLARYPPLVTTIAFALASGAGAQFLRGSAREV